MRAAAFVVPMLSQSLLDPPFRYPISHFAAPATVLQEREKAPSVRDTLRVVGAGAGPCCVQPDRRSPARSLVATLPNEGGM